MSQAVNLARLSDVNENLPLSNRNFFIDGAFDSWYGAASALPIALTTTAQYVSTMWVGYSGAGGAGNVNYWAGMNTAASNWLQYLDGGATYCMIWNQTTASTGTLAARNLPYFAQRLQQVAKLASKTVTVSFKLQCSAGSDCVIPGLLAHQNFGTGGSPSAAVILDKAVNWRVKLGDIPRRFSVRLDVPSVAGKTIGTNGNDLLQIGLWLPAGWTGTLNVMEAQIEISSPNCSDDLNGNGGAPTAFEFRGRNEEALRILPYYRQVQSTVMQHSSIAGANLGCQYVLSPPMRWTPAVSLARTYTSNCAATSSHSTSAAGTFVYCTATAAGQVTQFNDTVTLDARL
ncbi:hypothetical protein [Caballeronia zhejiangensis]|uniref:Uncharacterized protein n=1 Tax=Caballeronia zhejiangensis TaxID=871203 RepID=A0A656QFG1_9BURK|nr:hypothetical protein [Caballeronia zhejiangensis]KDR26002.1 hypothetical protein BG60_26480 [Caballeronia zhejiangensis]